MGIRALIKNVILTKKLGLQISLAAILLIGLVEIAFNVLTNVQRDYAWKGVESLLRNELSFSNSYQISRVLSDMEKVGWIECVRLTEKSNSRRIFYDTQSHGSCDIFVPYVENDLVSINGAKWELRFSLPSLRWIIFFRFLLPIIIIFLGYSIFEQIRLKKLTELQEKLNTELELKRLEDQLQYSRKFEEIARQVSHDIRSPLSALNMVSSTLKEIPEETRLLVRSATQRINDIANDLLQRGTKSTSGISSEGVDQSGVNSKLGIEHIPILIDMIVSEKRMQFKKYENISIDFQLNFQESFLFFSSVNANEIKRALSNLMNNSIEAFDDHSGNTVIKLSRFQRKNKYLIEIIVQDNGKGIPKHILDKLGQSGVTYGKENTQSGSGLGVYHAKKTIESFGGEFSIDSTEGKGTTVSILLPLAEAPDWFAQKINLAGKKYLVTLDDDSSIHQIWIERLSTAAGLNIEHIKFQSGESFEKYVNSNINRIKECIFLVDYELSNQAKTGFQIIEDLVIEKHSILVTSRYEDQDVLEKAKKLNLKILPKNLCGFVPLNLV